MSGESSSEDADTALEEESKTTVPLTESTKSPKLHGKQNKMNQDQERLLEERKQQFEEDRDEILRNIPKDSRKQFKELGFGKWNRDWLPVMILGPYDVAPGPVRDQWMSMAEKVRFDNIP